MAAREMGGLSLADALSLCAARLAASGLAELLYVAPATSGNRGAEAVAPRSSILRGGARPRQSNVRLAICE